VTGQLLVSASRLSAATYYVHPTLGDDHNPGTDAAAPWKTLERATAARLQAGDRVLLAAGQTFTGQLAFNELRGTVKAPIVFSSYSSGSQPADSRAVIDGRGYIAAIHLLNSQNIRISDLILTADGGGLKRGQKTNANMRCGVLVEADSAGTYSNFQLTNLLVEGVSYTEPGWVRPAHDIKTANGTLPYGFGIRFIVHSPAAILRHISVTDSTIRNVTHTGLKFTGPTNGLQQIDVQRLRVLDSGGPGVQISGVTGGRFSGLYVNGSGSTNDTRNWGRGSGLWTWCSRDVVIEHSQFLNANGPGDSAGVHIDYHCRNVVVQYNLSANNAGGFCEILGNNHNCAYRYNVSVNDGHRVKGQNGAFQEGKTLWLSGFIGNGRSGPFNSYVYNNTIYVSDAVASKVAIAPTTSGALVANNIFFIRGTSQSVVGDQFRPDDGKTCAVQNFVFENNLFLTRTSWPPDLLIQDRSAILGDPGFANPGGLKLEDYIPRNVSLVKDRGIRIPRIPGDNLGLAVGLEVRKDILGNKITGRPDLGAIELP
jgi:hypothetical protein